jgi:hypothetical protein
LRGESYYAPYVEIFSDRDDRCEVFFCDDTASLKPDNRADGAAITKLLEITPSMITMWPVKVSPGRATHLKPKYGNLRTIMIARRNERTYRIPSNVEELDEILDGLPKGFDTDWSTGLGLLHEYRFIISAIASIPDMTALMIHGGSKIEVLTPMYALGEKRLENILKQINKITGRHRRQSVRDKNFFAYRNLLHDADPINYPPQSARIESGVLNEATSLHNGRTLVSKLDHPAILKMLKDNAQEIAKSQPRELMRLKSEIEYVTLGELIQRFRSLMDKTKSERDWQLFFKVIHLCLAWRFQ